MRRNFLILTLLCATAGATYSSNKQDSSPSTTALTESSPTEILSTSSAAELSNPNVANLDATTAASTLQDTSAAGLVTSQNLSEDDFDIGAALGSTAQQPPRRRIITLDQRQEGQYNIRADLDNFMFILVPQSQSVLSELFLTRALSRGPSKLKDKAASKNPYSIPSYLKQHGNSKKYSSSNFNLRPANRPSSNEVQKQSPFSLFEGENTRRLSEFVEGRTPYHADIPAADDEHTRLQPDRQVDVLPPPYPLAYQHLKPYHLEAEPTVIQALPPQELQAAHVSDKFLETYNQLLTSGLKNAVAAAASADAGLRSRHNNDGPELGFYRLSRAIRNGGGGGGGSGNAFDSDNSLSLNAPFLSRSSALPIYRTEHSMGASAYYPPIDVPKSFGYFTEQRQQSSEARNQVLDEEQQVVSRAMLPILDITVPQDDVELELHGVSLLDRDAKTLLSDGMERCAPGHRRDSYGLCREIEGY